MYLRPEVLAFASAMESKLRKNNLGDGNAAWKNASPEGLFALLDQQCDELYGRMEDVTGTKNKVGAIRESAVDIANYAMMLTDIHDELPAYVPALEKATQKLVELISTDDPEYLPFDECDDSGKTHWRSHATIVLNAALNP